MADPIKKIRCSSLPRFVECASSVIDAEHHYKPGTSEMADLGTAAHEALALMVVDDEPDIGALAKEHHVDITDLRILYYWGKRAWDETLKQHFPEPKTEVEVESEITRGHADVIQGGDTAIILDWKTGYIRRNYSYQLAGYAHAYRATFGVPKSGQITSIVCWVRDGDIEVQHYDDEKLYQFEEIIRSTHEHVGDHYGPGDACTYCQRRLECPARAEFIWSCVKALQETDLKSADAKTIGELYPKTRVINKLIKDYDTILKGALVEHGTLSAGDGREIYLEDEHKYTVIPTLAYPILNKQYGISSNEFASLVKLGKTDMLNAVKAHVGRGEKGKIAAACIDELKAVKAIEVTLGKKLKTRREL